MRRDWRFVTPVDSTTSYIMYVIGPYIVGGLGSSNIFIYFEILAHPAGALQIRGFPIQPGSAG